MEEELTEVLTAWGERGPKLISAVLEERKRLLHIAAHQRDEMSSEIFEARNEIQVLREKNRQQLLQNEMERTHLSSAMNQLKDSVTSLTADLEAAKRNQRQLQTEMGHAIDERDNVLQEVQEKEHAAESLIASLRKEIQSEELAKATAMDSIRNIRKENMQWSKIAVEERMKVEKESRRANDAEAQLLDFQAQVEATWKYQAVERERIESHETQPPSEETIPQRKRKRVEPQSVQSGDEPTNTHISSSDFEASESCSTHTPKTSTNEASHRAQPRRKSKTNKQTSTLPLPSDKSADKTRRVDHDGNSPITTYALRSNADGRLARAELKQKATVCVKKENFMESPYSAWQETNTRTNVKPSPKRVRPRRNVSNATYVYPYGGDAELQTGDEYWLSKSKS